MQILQKTIRRVRRIQTIDRIIHKISDKKIDNILSSPFIKKMGQNIKHSLPSYFWGDNWLPTHISQWSINMTLQSIEALPESLLNIIKKNEI
ncbi:MAG: hypothetical protein ACR2NY_00640 [Alphaproteobacteria bacterium]